MRRFLMIILILLMTSGIGLAAVEIDTNADDYIDGTKYIYGSPSDTTIPRYDSTNDRLKSTGITVDDSDNVSGVGTITQDATATPSIVFQDSDTTVETQDAVIYANATDPTTDSEDVDLFFQVQENSVLTTKIQIIAGGYITFYDDLNLSGTNKIRYNGTLIGIDNIEDGSNYKKVAAAYVGTGGAIIGVRDIDGSGAFDFTGATATRHKTFRDADDTVVEQGGTYTFTAAQTFSAGIIVNEDIDINLDAADEEIVVTQAYNSAATINTVMTIEQTGSSVTGGTLLAVKATDADVINVAITDATVPSWSYSPVLGVEGPSEFQGVIYATQGIAVGASQQISGTTALTIGAGLETILINTSAWDIQTDGTATGFTISADSNTISNIDDGEIKNGANIDPAKLNLGAGVATWLGAPSSANLATAVTGETGTGALVFGTSPDFTTDIDIIGATPTVNFKDSEQGNDIGAYIIGNNDADEGTLTFYIRAADTPTYQAYMTMTGLGDLNDIHLGSASLAIDLALHNASTFSMSNGSDSQTVSLFVPSSVTALAPTANDGAALGTGSYSYSDLFLASGAVINFANSNAVITHSSGILNVSTGALQVGGAAVLVSGGALGTPSSATLTNATGLPSGGITTVVDSVAWDASGIVADGTQCADPAKVTLNSGPAQYTIICADNDGSTMYGHVTMPDSWDGGTVTLEMEYVQTAADTSALNMDVAMQCRGAGETVSSTWGSEIAIDDTNVTGSNGVDQTTSGAVTPAGTCAGGDALWWRVQLDATGTTTAVATLNFTGAKLEYTSNFGD